MRPIMRLQLAICILIMGMATTPSHSAPYPPKVPAGGIYVAPTPEKKEWALAMCAILTESNHRPHDLLGGCERTPEWSKGVQNLLAGAWRVNNRTDLLNTLKWLEEGGHRKDFDTMARELSKATPAQIAGLKAQMADNPSAVNQIDVVMKYKNELGAKSIAAWDYGRYVALCGWAYIAGYLTEDEAWRRIMPVATLLQKTFSSWQDLGNNYLVGRRFWSLKTTEANGEAMTQAYDTLLSNPDSPWVRLPWNPSASTSKTNETKRLTPIGPKKLSPSNTKRPTKSSDHQGEVYLEFH